MKKTQARRMADNLARSYRADYSTLKNMVLKEPDREKALRRLSDIERELEKVDEPKYRKYLELEDRTEELDGKVNKARNLLLESIREFREKNE